MSRILVIPDIHLKPELFDYAEKILKDGKADRAVCLMDIPDDWNCEIHIDKYENTYDRAIKFAKDFPDTLWCYGNHDISYLWGRFESGYSKFAESTVRIKLRELLESLPKSNQLAFVHRIGNVIFSHGGLSERFILELTKTVDAGLFKDDIDNVLYVINNNLSPEILWDDESPLWLRPQYGVHRLFRGDKYTQVVGHTPIEEIYKDGLDETGRFITTDTYSTYRDGGQIGPSAMIVIDSESCEFDKIFTNDREREGSYEIKTVSASELSEQERI